MDTPTNPVIAYFDGCCLPTNPGGYACGGWVIEGHPALKLWGANEGWRCYGSGSGMTNNVAEYEAAIDALLWIKGRGYRGHVILYGDSQLVVGQYEGTMACRTPHLVRRLNQLTTIAADFKEVELAWVKRSINGRADALSRRAYEQARSLDAPLPAFPVG